MADEKKAEGAEGAKGGKKKLMIIIIAAVLALAGGGGGYFYMQKQKEAAELAKKKKKKKKAAEEEAAAEDEEAGDGDAEHGDEADAEHDAEGGEEHADEESGDEEHAEDEEEEEEHEEEAAAEGGGGEHGGGGESAYLPLAPAFVVNFRPGPNGEKPRAKFMSVEIEVLPASPAVGEKIKGNMPLVRNAVIMLLSEKTYDELVTPEGKEELRKEMIAKMQAVLKKPTKKKKSIKDIFFTSFVMQ
jgi:flagellar basal body-associated protein FliL